MFENLLYQDAGRQLAQDFSRGNLPQSLLFSGPVSSGKLTAALELARVLSCKGGSATQVSSALGAPSSAGTATGGPATVRGSWGCTCPSCKRHKALLSNTVLVAGPRDCALEIGAARDTLLRSVRENDGHLTAASYLFVRSVRKLLVRFSPVLWANDPKAAKAFSLVSDIEDALLDLDPGAPHTGSPLPPPEKLEKLLGSIYKDAAKLESDFLYSSIPVSHIRSASEWARLTVPDGKKVLVIENAEQMQDSVRNALLKIIEEPPEDVLFVLTTSQRSAVMPTILSRVRTYTFAARTKAQQQEVIQRIFHEPLYAEKESVNAYLSEYLPVPAAQIESVAARYLESVRQGLRPDISALLKELDNFSVRAVLKVFYAALMRETARVAAACGAPPQTGVASFVESTPQAGATPQTGAAGGAGIPSQTDTTTPQTAPPDQTQLARESEKAARRLSALRSSYEEMTIYNISPQEALEVLTARMIGGAA